MQTSEVDANLRKFVRSRATGAFLSTGGAWTTEPAIATVFPSIEAAIAAAMDHRLTDAELYYQFGQQPSQYDFTLPL